MKLALLITVMLTLALAQAVNKLPCQLNRNNNAPDEFLKRHIVSDSFNRNSKDAWKTYLGQKNLCHRPTQSFIESASQADVEDICRGAGHQVVNGGNLCISSQTFQVYQLSVNTRTCDVRSLTKNYHQVVVACDKVANQCRPVHYEGFRGQRPNNNLVCR